MAYVLRGSIYGECLRIFSLFTCFGEKATLPRNIPYPLLFVTLKTTYNIYSTQKTTHPMNMGTKHPKKHGDSAWRKA